MVDAALVSRTQSRSLDQILDLTVGKKIEESFSLWKFLTPFSRMCTKSSKKESSVLRQLSVKIHLTGRHYGKTSSSATSPNEDETSPSSTAKQFTYVDLVEKCTFGECFAFSDYPKIREEIDSALMKISYKISLQYQKTKGRARKELDERVRKFHVTEGQAKTIQEFNNNIESLHGEIGILQDELQEWISKCKNLEEEKERIYAEMVLEAKRSERKTQSLREENKELEDYIKSLEKSLDISSFKGKPLSDVKNKYRTLKTFLSRAQTALWFSKSFGIELESLSVKESGTGVTHKV